MYSIDIGIHDTSEVHFNWKPFKKYPDCMILNDAHKHSIAKRAGKSQSEMFIPPCPCLSIYYLILTFF